MNEISKVFLEQGDKVAGEVPLGYMTTIFSLAATQLRMKENPSDLLQLAQNMMKSMVRTPDDLMIVLSTRWPLWGMAHMCMVLV